MTNIIIYSFFVLPALAFIGMWIYSSAYLRSVEDASRTADAPRPKTNSRKNRFLQPRLLRRQLEANALASRVISHKALMSSIRGRAVTEDELRAAMENLLNGLSKSKLDNDELDTGDPKDNSDDKANLAR